MGTVKSKPCDFIVTTYEFEKNFAEQDNVVFVRNIVDVNEMKQKLSEYFEKIGG